MGYRIHAALLFCASTLCLGLACAAACPARAVADDGLVPIPQAEAQTGLDASAEGTDYEQGCVVVSLRRGTTMTELHELAAGTLALDEDAINDTCLVGATVSDDVIVDDADLDPVVKLVLAPGATVAQAAAELEGAECVLSAQPSWNLAFQGDDTAERLEAQTTNVNDSAAGKQWGLSACRLAHAWDITRSNHAVTVAIMDTGIRSSHKDLAGNLIGTYNAFDKRANTGDQKGHGTHVAGIACAVANNGLGIAGTSYNADLLAIKISDASGSNMTSAAVIEGYNYVIKNRASLNIRVVNLSIGAQTSKINTSDALLQRITAAKNAGILTVCSAGNGSGAYTCYPADYDDCLSIINVAKTDTGYVRSSTSNYNKSGVTATTKNATKDLCAPGANIYSTTNTSDTSFGYDSGTSMASPAVAGIAALCFARNPALSPAQVQTILQNTATNLGAPGWDREYGYGLVNAQAALSQVPKPSSTVSKVDMHRLYNPNSGEHFYTSNTNEKNSLVRAGWRYEGKGWTSVSYSNAPVYRMYNPNAGDHHYTMSPLERSSLIKAGWSYEGIGWYSGGSVPLYRQYNPNAATGTHNYTASGYERNALVRLGWRDEGIAWYGQ